MMDPVVEVDRRELEDNRRPTEDQLAALEHELQRRRREAAMSLQRIAEQWPDMVRALCTGQDPWQDEGETRSRARD